MTPTDMTMNAYGRVASYVATLCELPAVATPDWCQRVAAAAAGLCQGSRAGAIVAMVEPGGRIVACETSGYAACPTHAITIRTNDEVSARSRMERLASIGFSPGEHAASGHLTGRLSVLPASEVTRTPLPTDALDAPASRVVASFIHLPDSAPGCSLVVFVAVPESGASSTDEIARALEAGAPILARRASMALGNAPCESAPWLTAREQEVLEQLILGRSVKQIAGVLGRSPHTVHDHVKSLHRKLNATTRGGLVARALGRPDIGTERNESPGKTTSASKGTPAA
jgi:DNA-binding CsgD family transcriptional regulator